MPQKTNQKETPGQDRMPDTGAALDPDQSSMLDSLLNSSPQPGRDVQEGIDDAEDWMSKNPEREIPQVEDTPEEPETELEAEVQDQDDDFGPPIFDEEVADEPEEETTDTTPDPIAELKAEIAAMRAEMQGKQKEEEPAEEKIDFSVDPQYFFTAEEAEELMIPSELLGKILARVYTKVREDTYTDIPKLIASVTQRQQSLLQVRQRFWQENADLKALAEKNPAVQAFIRSTANEISSKNPAWPVERIFKETGERVRAAINLKGTAKGAEKNAQSSGGPPRKPRSGNRRSGDSGDSRTKLQQDIDSIINV